MIATQHRTRKKKREVRDRAVYFKSGCLTAEFGFDRFNFVCAFSDGCFVMMIMIGVKVSFILRAKTVNEGQRILSFRLHSTVTKLVVIEHSGSYLEVRLIKPILLSPLQWKAMTL